MEIVRIAHLQFGHFAPRSGAGKLARGMRFLSLEYFDDSGICTLKGCRGLLAPLPGCDSWCASIPGVRKKRVPLANLLAPLRGAEASVLQQHSGFAHLSRKTFAS